ncbi:hypothetical protein HDF16_000386 [Granulicella aggregans]|uniref:Uncharacterized protein n=1 Tax=Granulicella aggregans TaxID=474949 RepID=A0A7W7Z9F1_9BACT|nr:hypothetical protein [Granulicella aggregans]MBB5055717.1 hypothetical protein [Granulicella aggregans]
MLEERPHISIPHDLNHGLNLGLKGRDPLETNLIAGMRTASYAEPEWTILIYTGFQKVLANISDHRDVSQPHL